MGCVSPDDSAKGLKGAIRFFREFVPKLGSVNEWSISDVYMLIIVLGLYFYSKYYRCGNKNGTSYEVYPSTIGALYEDYDKTLSKLVKRIILARNFAVHATYTDDTDLYVRTTVNNANLVKLLRCEGIIDRNGDFVEPELGSYDSCLNETVARLSIKSSIDKMNAEDKKQDESKTIPSILSAVSKMGE